MWIIIKFFSRRIIKNAFFLLLATVFVPLCIEKLGVPLALSWGLLMEVAFMAAIGTHVYNMGRNMTWILTLPISKSKIFFSNSILGLFTYLSFFLASAIGTLALFLIRKPNLDQLNREALSALIHTPINSYFVMGIVIAIDTALLFSSTIHRFDAETVAIRMNKFQRTAFLTILGVAIIVVPLWMNISRVGAFIAFSLFGITVAVFFTHSFTTALGMSKLQKFRWIKYAALIAAIQVAGVGGYAYQQFYSHDAEKRLNAKSFLGLLSPKLSNSSYFAMFESDLKPGVIWPAIVEYRKDNPGFKSFDPERRDSPNLEKVITSKSDPYSVFFSTFLFNPTALKINDIDLILNQYQKLLNNSSEYLPGYFAIPAEISPAVVVEHYLKSPNERYQAYGLARARFYRDPVYASIILQMLDRNSEKLRASAELTLSILYGERFNKRSKPSFARVDCSNFKPKFFSDIKETDLPALNICLRESVRKGAFDRIRDADRGWVEKLPLNGETKKAAGMAFGTVEAKH